MNWSTMEAGFWPERKEYEASVADRKTQHHQFSFGVGVYLSHMIS